MTITNTDHISLTSNSNTAAKILFYLTSSQLWQAVTVCKQWHKAINSHAEFKIMLIFEKCRQAAMTIPMWGDRIRMMNQISQLESRCRLNQVVRVSPLANQIPPNPLLDSIRQVALHDSEGAKKTVASWTNSFMAEQAYFEIFKIELQLGRPEARGTLMLFKDISTYAMALVEMAKRTRTPDYSAAKAAIRMVVDQTMRELLLCSVVALEAHQNLSQAKRTARELSDPYSIAEAYLTMAEYELLKVVVNKI